MRREVPLIITLVIGLVVVLSSVTTGNIPGTETSFVSMYQLHISPWMRIVSSFAVGLAAVNLLKLHGFSIARKRPGWVYSVLLIGSMAIFAGFRSYIELNLTNQVAAKNYALLYDNIRTPLSQTIFALIAFYIASASYRAFRARSVESSVLLISAVIVMLGAAPVGALIWNKFPVIQQWLIAVPNMTGQRAIMIGAAIGGFAASLRILLGQDRSYLGGGE